MKRLTPTLKEKEADRERMKKEGCGCQMPKGTKVWIVTQGERKGEEFWYCKVHDCMNYRKRSFI